MPEDPKETVRSAAQQASLPLPEERVEALAQNLPFLRAGVESLAQLDLGQREPAFIFRPKARG